MKHRQHHIRAWNRPSPPPCAAAPTALNPQRLQGRHQCEGRSPARGSFPVCSPMIEPLLASEAKDRFAVRVDAG